MFKKIFISLFIVILLAFGGLTYYVSTIDWNKYKGKITTEIEDVTGKKVVINGKVGLKFLPKPHLNATDIKIFNPNAKNPNKPLAEIKEIVTDLSLMPLLHKRFEIDNMNLVDANILVEFLNDGKTNWYSNIGDDQSLNFSGIDIAFNSVMLQNAVVHIINQTLNVDITLKKLNADISAQSLSGPFRMDGNFIKDGTPAGFALNVGTLSESFATSLNLVLTHPASDSYARFDGSVLSNNSEIQGNFTIESQKPSTFLNTISSQNLLPEQYNKPLAASIELTVNPNQVDLSSFIIKYADSMAGAGKVLIPLKAENNERKKIEVAFEMTDFDMMPFDAFLKQYLKKFENNKKPYEPSFEYDVIADIMATRAHYNGEIIRDFKFTADFINNLLTIKNLSGLLPGDTDISLKGDIFENEKVLSYDLKIQGLSQDFLKFLEFTGHKPQTYAESTYRTARASFGLSGNLNQIKLLPFDFSLDKIETSGVIGIKRGRRNSFFVSLQSENVNFDNYFPQMENTDEKAALSDRINTVLNHFKFLNDIDLQAEIDLKLGIYNKVPFENMLLNVKATDGKIELKKLDIEQIASARLQLDGICTNLGIIPTFENLKYNIETADFASFVNKTKLNLPDWPLFKDAHNVKLNGVISGTLDNAKVKSEAKIEKTNGNYEGSVYRQDGKTYWRGALEIKDPDFVNFLNQIGVSYNPSNLSVSLFNFKSNIEGSALNWRALDMNSFIGLNNFTGSFSYNKTNEKPQIKANIQMNMFEFDRFIFAPEKNKNTKTRKTTAKFLEKPTFTKTLFDYDDLKKFDFAGKLTIKNLSYLSNDIENVSFILENKGNVLNVRNFSAEKNGSPIKSNFSINFDSKPKIKGSFEIKDYLLEDFGGTTYTIKKGKLALKSTFEGDATSEADFIKTAKINTSFDISKAEVNGLDIEMIEDDLSKRDHSQNLETFLINNLSGGQSLFDVIGGDFNMEDKKYTIKEAVMTSPLVTIDWSSEGSIENWETDTTFHVIFERLKETVLPFNFKLEGSISDPALTLDVKDLTNKYDSYWQQIEQEKKEKEEKRIKDLHDRMDISQKKVESQINLINSEILPRIELYQKTSSDSRSHAVYESVSIQINDILSKLKEMKALTFTTYTHKDIDDINLQTEVYEPSLQDIISQLDSNYLFDLKLHISANFKTISNIYQNSLEKSENYQNTLDAYTMRLMQLGSIVTLNDLDEVKQYRTEIEDSIKKIAEIYNQSLKIAESTEGDDVKIIQLTKNYEKIGKLSNSAQDQLNILDVALKDLFEYVQDVVYFEQTGKHKHQENEEKQPESEEQVTVEKETVEKEKNDVLVNAEPIVQKDEQDEQNMPHKFTHKETSDEQEPEYVIEVQEKTISEADVQKDEKPTEPVKEIVVEEKEELKPLLIEATDDYTTTAIGGTITRKGTKAIEPVVKQEEKKPLLKPIEGEVLIEGTIKRK